jgi:hypothetical protein
MPEMIPGSRFLSGNPVNVVLHWVLACTRCYDLFTELDSREYGPIRSLCASALAKNNPDSPGDETHGSADKGAYRSAVAHHYLR